METSLDDRYYVYCGEQKIGFLSYPKEKIEDENFEIEKNIKVFMKEGEPFPLVKVSLGMQFILFSFVKELQSDKVIIKKGQWKYDDKTGGSETLTFLKEFDLNLLNKTWKEI